MDGLIAIACALKGKTGEVYNLASGKEQKIRELAETIIYLLGILHPFNLNLLEIGTVRGVVIEI